MDSDKSVTAYFSSVDVMPPEVLSVTPEDGATEVPVDTTISVEFSEEMDRASVEGAFSLAPEVQGNFTWEGNSPTFALATDLEYGTKYTVTVSTTAKDKAGNTLAGAYTWSFNTLAKPGLPWWVWPIIGVVGVCLVVRFANNADGVDLLPL